MRLAVVGGLLAALSACTFAVTAQEFGKDRKDKSSLIQELGGKTLEQWIKDISGKDRSKGEHAIHMVLLFPPEQAYSAVPALLGELNKHKPGYPIDLSIRVNCVIALGGILGATKDPSPAHVKEAVRLFTSMLTDSQSILRFRAAEALGRMGPEAHSAMTALIPIVKDGTTWEVRYAAAQALGLVSVDREKKEGPTLGALNALYYALTDSSARVRMAAIQSLTTVGRSANPEYKKGLLKQLEVVTQKDVDAGVQIWAHMAIMNISNDISETRMAAIGKMLEHHEAAVRIQAATAIGVVAGAFAKEARKQVPSLAAALKDKDIQVVGTCIVALARFGRTAQPALAALERVKGDMALPEALRKTAEEAIDVIQGKAGGKAGGKQAP